MKFSEYVDCWVTFQKCGLDKSFGVKDRDGMYATPIYSHTALGVRHGRFDYEWVKNRRPYYDVYPAIIPMLTRLDLKIKANMIKPPQGINHLLVRLPENHKLAKTIWISFQMVNSSAGKNDLVPGLIVGADIGNDIPIDGVKTPTFEIRCIPLLDKPLVEIIDGIQARVSDGIADSERLRNILRLAVTVCMIGNNPDFVSPQVITKDRNKVTEDNVLRLVNKAIKRGKFGFSLGEGYQKFSDAQELLETQSSIVGKKSPHLRVAHLALVYYGTNKSIARIVMRNSSFVNKHMLKEVPTGYFGK